MAENTKPVYEVMSPWADADPVPPRGLSERLDTLDGKKIGLYYMWKRASKPMLEVVERLLLEKYPSVKLSWYQESEMNTPEIESRNKDKFEEWLKTVDGVIMTYGD